MQPASTTGLVGSHVLELELASSALRTVSLILLTGKEETVIVWQASFEARSRGETQKMEDVVMHLIMSGHNSLADYLQQQ
ncbi:MULTISPECIES: hypothetical protein [unclassified Erwinia]|uniref:hypothetical protein n=1 Tax=unclassified Erwinia TaxID=2622719 RepID=UPI0030971088